MRELRAIMVVVQKWRHYLFGSKFIIEIHQKSLKEPSDNVVETLDQHYYLSKLLGYDFDIAYKHDKENMAADTLSRIELEANQQRMI